MIRWAGCALLVVLSAGGLIAAGVDYADSRHAGLWLQHPVYGGPSFDAFVHAPHIPCTAARRRLNGRSTASALPIPSAAVAGH